MVKLLSFLLALSVALPALAITPDELRAMSENQQREDYMKGNRANTGSMGALIPAAPPKSRKYSSQPDKPVSRAPAARKSTSAPTPAPVVNENIYIPPARENGASGQAFVSDAVKVGSQFGIRTGAWLKGELRRNTTSAESGSVELQLTSDFSGDRRILPRGTVVFADKSLNTATKRMELMVTHGITPDGKEFEMRGLVFDPKKTPGLVGIFVLDKTQVASKGFTKGALAAVGAVAGNMTGSVGATAANAATQSIVNDTEQATGFKNDLQAVIYVAPQELLIRVESGF